MSTLSTLARRFDFFDIGVVEMLRHRLQKVETVYKGNDMLVTFHGRIAGKRRSTAGVDEYKVTWEPANMWVISFVDNRISEISEIIGVFRNWFISPPHLLTFCVFFHVCLQIRRGVDQKAIEPQRL